MGVNSLGKPTIDPGFLRFAHSNPAFPNDLSCWEPLVGEDGHLEAVSRHCQRFAGRTFHQLPELLTLAEVSARWHDLGKFSKAFQRYLRIAGGDVHNGEVCGRVDHSSAGAQYAMKKLPPPLNAMVAYVIAGHHAGLYDGIRTQGTSLMARLQKKGLPPWQEAVPKALLEAPTVAMPKLNADKRADIAFQLGFATRMLFSCLVDADFLATEAFMNPVQAGERMVDGVDFSALDRHLTDYLTQRFRKREGKVAAARAEVLATCRSKAIGKPGFYSLTVPTGGGKTLSSLAFALRHCVQNDLDRVIYAIPFTSIIEQTAEVFRKTFEGFPAGGDALVLEHHSNFDPDRETTRNRLTSENWDAPLIVTTNVQLFESLFANRTSRCRKLHNIAKSVIVLDEAQMLPVDLLKPCLKALRLLVEQYGCTIVLCTATQPAIEFRAGKFEIGLPAPTPIIDDAQALYTRLKRVDVHQAGVLDCASLAAHMSEIEQGLTIVNTRRHAVAVFGALKQAVGADGCFHLSAAMTPVHRNQVLREIRWRLRRREPCRVVATQLIEAGVDVDFPMVWRALTGLDSIAQAAGRCNREGRRDRAVTWIFEPKEEEFRRLIGMLGSSADAAGQVIASGRHTDLLGLAAIEHYFNLHYWQQQAGWDRRGICGAFRTGDRRLPLDCDFASVADRFRFIDDTQRPIVVGWGGQGEAVLRELNCLHGLGLHPNRILSRRLQRQTVSVSQWIWEQALAEGKVEILCDRFAVLSAPQLYYNDELGLQLDADPFYDPNMTIV